MKFSSLSWRGTFANFLLKALNMMWISFSAIQLPLVFCPQKEELDTTSTYRPYVLKIWQKQSHHTCTIIWLIIMFPNSFCFAQHERFHFLFDFVDNNQTVLIVCLISRYQSPQACYSIPLSLCWQVQFTVPVESSGPVDFARCRLHTNLTSQWQTPVT